MNTTISTIKNGVPMYLTRGPREDIDKATHNDRNVFLSPESAPVTIHRVEGGTIVIGIKTARCLDGQLVPSYGKAEVGRGLGTHKDRDKPIDQANRRWRPIKVDGGWHVQYDKESTLFLGLSDDGAPTLTPTPTLWTIPDLKRPEEDKDAEILALKAKVATLEAKVADRDAKAQAAIKSIIGAV